MAFLNLLWSRPTLVLATVGLTLLVGSRDQPLSWTLGLAAFIVVHSLATWWRARSLPVRLGHNYDRLLRRVLRLIADLSDLTAREFDLWMVDLYVQRTSVVPSTSHPYLIRKRLVRQLSLALTDVRALPSEIELTHAFYGPCLSKSQPGIWWDNSLVSSTKASNNKWFEVGSAVNDELRQTAGMISVNPIVDGLGQNCRGLLVVHTRSDSEIATKALGVLTQSEGLRRLSGACEDIHSYLRR